jgi:hypothetical protein
MKKKIKLSVLSIFLSLSLFDPSFAKTYFVATAGSDDNAGSEKEPFATMTKGQTAAAAGDTVYIRGGTYKFVSETATDGVTLSKSGSSGKRINYWAYPGETPVFDFTGLTAQVRNRGIHVTGSWLHLKGLELTGVPQNLRTVHESWCVYNNGGGNNIYELLNMHHNMGPGLFIVKGGNNLVVNCDSHDNYDKYSSSDGKTANAPGENADGFGCHSGAGQAGNIFRGCRAWWNTDDGWDFIQAQEVVVAENCWSWLNGYVPGTTTAIGNGNGFKGGGYGLPPTNVPSGGAPKHVIRNCVAFLNRASGFYQNHHPAACFWYNNTAFNNKSANFNMQSIEVSGSDYTSVNKGVLRNNIAYKGVALASGTGSGVDAQNNTWNLSGVTVSDTDFLSVDTAGIYGPRKADGGLPDVKFMKLASGSNLVDKGLDIGLPFSGKAPDLGAYETGMTLIFRLEFLKRNGKAPPHTPAIENPGSVLVYTISGRRMPSGSVAGPHAPLGFVMQPRNGMHGAAIPSKFQE